MWTDRGSGRLADTSDQCGYERAASDVTDIKSTMVLTVFDIELRREYTDIWTMKL